MRSCRQFYIDGAWVDPILENDWTVINPATEEPIAVISLGSAQDVDKAVVAAKQAFESFSESSVDERLTLLRSILAVYQSRMEEMAATISSEMGAPMALARAAQAPVGVRHLSAAISALSTLNFEAVKGSTMMRKEPIGVCGLITPWNWPMNQIVCKVAPAIAAGCTMILKPSEFAPISAYLFAEILHAAGVPPGVFNLVNGDGAGVGSAISSHPDIAMVSFTGSARAGACVAVAAASTVKRVTQELGGKSAYIVLDDADLDAAAKACALACFRNTGQSCNAPTRLLVPQSRMAAASAVAKQAAESLAVGAPAEDSTAMGPLANKAQFEKVQRMIQQAIQEGAELAAGGAGKPAGFTKGYFVKPTVLANVRPEMTCAREEIFGPVLSIIAYRDEEDAIRIANDTPYGLSGYVASGNLDRARRVAKRIRSGNVHVNDARLDFDACFGGYKQSGNGREWGQAGIEEFLELKAIFGYAAQAQ
ncbi:MAG TPA: aldehyde dehydrogenase family protein [Candidatus Aquilonibacter sp.]|nr:aldehyde dehydrogenase family protein [Candidatus Aquilonibacter sp.]